MHVNTIIIGAGVAGLAAAKLLQTAGISYKLIEKSSEVGGRLSTITIGENGVADVGAQFFTARSDEFQSVVDEWLKSGLAYQFSTEWTDGSLKQYHHNDEPRYVIRGGMMRLAEQLASELDSLYLNKEVVRIQYIRGLWRIDVRGDHVCLGENLIVTLPAPQALKFFDSIALSDEARKRLNRIHYTPTLAGVFVIDGETTLPPSGGLQTMDGDGIFQWVVDNKTKGISESERVITVQTKRVWSKNHFALEDDAILAEMKQALQPHLTSGTTITAAALTRWEYSLPVLTDSYSILEEKDLSLIFAGDAFGGRGCVEGAYLSGITAGQVIAQKPEIASL